ncbi:MAG TPA: 5'-3' exonuclease H3TH domain-containing protein [Candidatus Paceibacterota bacterium]|nr:hypothetical protein [Verrucomicrobiota bacterium]HOX03335.1 5'-3' exonuclease H3TH domain-containing protein [Verrucomicrobiota bacterium]HRZ46255.1 5'-3' exonuclease H3TH domain-containing protein [Candidatus Paceibacterota bacterium]HRZ93200.1 5'-3' exonuclease H3TH domain-containing protein [Candidatus Paceibacterota bacterium]
MEQGLEVRRAGGASPERRLLLVDGHAYAYRAYHALQRLSGPDGAPTHAIYGFIKMLGRLRIDCSPTHWMVVWDGGLDAGRVAALPEYKSNRPPMPKDLAAQLPGMIEYLEAARVAWRQEDGIEADDAIASLCRQAVAQGAWVTVASSDKDFMQLVGERVGLENPSGAAGRRLGVSEVVEKTGVRPEQVVDWLSLIGDAVDNVAGVPGIGPKTASKLLAQFGSAEELYGRLSEVEPAAVREKLGSSQAVVRRNQGLIRLRSEVRVEMDWDGAAVRPGDEQRLRSLYERWGFRSLAAELGGLRQGELW